ncbi:MAG: hypothetical protein MI975_01780 [Cytophagales bacterium]|nr:hypothetical protein [Cytophagales bacterium]
MKKVLFFIVVALIVYGCAPSKKAVDLSIGTWDYVIKDTPEGDLDGHFIIAKEGDDYTGSLNSDQGSIVLEDITIEDGNLKCTFDFQGYEILMKGTFEGNSYAGNVSVDYNEFPMTATRRE